MLCTPLTPSKKTMCIFFKAGFSFKFFWYTGFCLSNFWYTGFCFQKMLLRIQAFNFKICSIQAFDFKISSIQAFHTPPGGPPIMIFIIERNSANKFCIVGHLLETWSSLCCIAWCKMIGFHHHYTMTS